MISSLSVLFLVAAICALTTTPLIFQCCKKKGKKDNKKPPAKQPEKGGAGPESKSKEVGAKDAAGKDAAGKDGAAKDGGAKPPPAEQVQKKPEDKKKAAAGKGDAKNVKLPVTYHVVKGKPTSSELAKKTTATAQIAMPPTTTLPVVGPGAASKDGKQSSGVATAQKASAAKSATGGSKATDVKSGTNDGKFSFYFKLFSINF
uniref:Uncharacterized protein n=1 Tax=Meloidogyne enterolobii TaxID=390850 RepID=A0A6V7USZ0_MELEN|nr:unnamed protein product [Meloidogyne enterolobii]